MPQFIVEIAADPKQVADLKRFIDEQAQEQRIPIETKPQALDRDASTLHIALTAVTTQAIGLLFSFIKDYVRKQLKKQDKPAFAIQIGNTHLSIKEESDLAELDDLEQRETEDMAD